MEQIRQNIFRQTMFVEFERIIHDPIDKEQPLSAEALCDIWHKLQIKYYRDDIVIDQKIDIEWARIPHFYSNYYDYQYYTGDASAIIFANSILNIGLNNNLILLYY